MLFIWRTGSLEKKKNFEDSYQSYSDYKAIVDYADSLQKTYDLKHYLANKGTCGETNLILLYCFHLFLFARFKRKTKDLITSHSFGEYSSLVAAKVISFESMLNIIIKRTEYTRGINHIDMYAADIAAENIEPMENITLCLKNSSRQYIYAIERNDIEGLRLLQEKADKVRKIDLDKPYHSHYLKKAAAKLENYILDLDIKIDPPIYKLLSNVRRDYIADNITQRELARLLSDQLTKQIDFPKQMSKLETSRIYEISPRPVSSL